MAFYAPDNINRVCQQRSRKERRETRSSKKMLKVRWWNQALNRRRLMYYRIG